ncbi:MAG TPA: hypothetical protein VI564_01155 [Candidatus Nanoarchaeia archaeon]|nr:hypothetical protein [Candidatus Nanoarchaeia archaeon]
MGSVNNRFLYAAAELKKNWDLGLFLDTMNTGNKYISRGNTEHGHLTHDFTKEELHSAIERAGFKDISILGVFSLLGKYFHSDKLRNFLNGASVESFLELQLKYAQVPEHINNSTDFFFVCKK